MNNSMDNLVYMMGKLDRRHIQLFFILLSLSLLVLGAGAPATGGGIPGGGG